MILGRTNHKGNIYVESSRQIDGKQMEEGRMELDRIDCRIQKVGRKKVRGRHIISCRRQNEEGRFKKEVDRR